MKENDWDNIGTNIEWEVVDRTGNPKPKKCISVWQMQGSFMANVHVNKAIMKTIFSRWPVSDFEGVGFYGRIDGSPDWFWEIPIAAASVKSDDYKDFKAHYPNSRITSLFVIYRQLADETKVYCPIQEVFKEFGADIEFEGGNKKILNSKAEDLPFYPQLRAKGINGKTRVIYDAAGNGFSIKPLPNK
jgi:hypothetical protein